MPTLASSCACCILSPNKPEGTQRHVKQWKRGSILRPCAEKEPYDLSNRRGPKKGTGAPGRHYLPAALVRSHSMMSSDSYRARPLCTRQGTCFMPPMRTRSSSLPGWRVSRKSMVTPAEACNPAPCGSRGRFSCSTARNRSNKPSVAPLSGKRQFFCPKVNGWHAPAAASVSQP